jgi:RHH-type proline utilization regulon transcriptional repressor/proline dehydrogenase/delta 1-pyrroline-5-carboxylate dehydrogenase
MLGEAALTAADARGLLRRLRGGHRGIARAATSTDVAANPGISIKLSALFPRYEVPARPRHGRAGAARQHSCARPRDAGIGISIDAEEADRLDLSLDVIEAVCARSGPCRLGRVRRGGAGLFPRAGAVIDWLTALAVARPPHHGAAGEGRLLGHRDQARAGRGAEDFPVFTRKAATDVSYLACARKLGRPTGSTRNSPPTTPTPWPRSWRWPATGRDGFEFQRLHGMGEALHEMVRAATTARACRIYAPVGAHRDLLAYLVRRLLENGANLLRQPGARHRRPGGDGGRAIRSTPTLGAPHPRVVATGRTCSRRSARTRGASTCMTGRLAKLDAARDAFAATEWSATAPDPCRAQAGRDGGAGHEPRATGDRVGTVTLTAPPMSSAPSPRPARGRPRRRRAPPSCAAPPISTRPTRPRSSPCSRGRRARPRRCRGRTARGGRFPALLRREARRSLPHPRAASSPASARGTSRSPSSPARSPPRWPPATRCWPNRRRRPRSSPRGPRRCCTRRASRARRCSFCRGTGEVGAALTSDPADRRRRLHRLDRDRAGDPPRHGRHLAPDAPLIAETGGLNAMIVDSTALPEQAVRDIIASAFQSAGQRCSALRCLYVQEDVADAVLKMLFGAMDELAPRRSMGPSHRCRPGDRRRRHADDRRLYRRGGGRGAAAAPVAAPGTGISSPPCADRGCAASPISSARSSARSCTSRPSGRGDRRGDRGDQRHRLRPDLRAAHPDRHAGAGGSRATSGSAMSMSTATRSAPSWAASPSAARPVGHGAEGGRPGLCRALLKLRG